MPLYFAYGANMDRADMAGRCPNSRALGPARLARHRFVITRDGYASVVRDPHASVHGLLWDCALGDIRTLDAFENIAGGLYVKISQPVILRDGAKRALLYVGRNGEVGRPRPGYLEAVIASAKELALPAAYIIEMTRFLNHATPAATLPRHEPGPVAGVRTRARAPATGLPARPASRRQPG